MIPTTMKFSSLPPKFQILRTGASNYRVRAVGQVMAGQGPTFTISGTGEFPPLQNQTNTKAPSQLPVLPKSIMSASDHTAPPSSSVVGASSPRPTLKLLLACGALLGSCTLIAWRARKMYMKAIRGCRIPSAVQPAPLLDGLKDELFQLESDRIRGSISGQEYASARRALEQIVERVVAGRQDGSQRG